METRHQPHHIEKEEFIRVLKSEYNVALEPPAYTVPELIDLDFTSVNDEKLVKMFSGDLLDFLRSPKLKYQGIKGHEDRRAIRDKVEAFYPEHTKMLSQDKMKMNRFSNFHNYVQMILNTEVGKTNARLQEALMQFPTYQEVSEYHTMKDEEKNTFIDRIESAARNFIQLFESEPKVLRKAA